MSAAHASRTPPGTDRGCRDSTAEVPNAAAAAAASDPHSTVPAVDSKFTNLLGGGAEGVLEEGGSEERACFAFGTEETEAFEG